MKCPYAVTRREINQTNMEYDENGNQTSYSEIRNSIAMFVNCEKENCGAWRDGKCCYAGTDRS